jgi:hypothetical protein
MCLYESMCEVVYFDACEMSTHFVGGCFDSCKMSLLRSKIFYLLYKKLMHCRKVFVSSEAFIIKCNSKFYTGILNSM